MNKHGKAIFVFYSREKRYEFEEGVHDVVVRLHSPFNVSGMCYQPGDEIVIPREVAKRINCEILRDWKIDAASL